MPYAELSPEAFKQVLVGAGLPSPLPDVFVDADVQIARGALFDDSKTLSTLIGRPTTSLAASVKAALAR